MTMDVDLWSMADLKAVERGDYNQYVAQFIKMCDDHVVGCEVIEGFSSFVCVNLIKIRISSSASLVDISVKYATDQTSFSLGGIVL